MNAKLKFRSVVFKRAYLLVKRNSCSFSEALKEAWAEYREHREILQNRDKLIDEISGILKVFEVYHSKADNLRMIPRWQPVRGQANRELNEKLRTIFI